MKLLVFLVTAMAVALCVEGVVSVPREKRAESLSLESLSALVMQQAETIDSLQTKVTALEHSRLQPVAFTAHFAADDGLTGIPLPQGGVLKFDVTTTNIGNGYDNTTGVFTAPVTGVYSFFLTAMAVNDKNQSHLLLDIEKEGGVVLDRIYAWGGAVYDDQGTTQITTYLNEGERVWVRQVDGVTIRGSFWTLFTGYLIQAM